MNLSSILSLGANGLAASTAGTQVASQNISNSATPGYSRQEINLEAIPLSESGGVRATGTTRVQDQFLERRGLGAASANGEADARVKTLSVVDSVFADGSGSIGDALDAFDSALTDLGSNPNSTETRQVVLSRASDLANAFHSTSDALTGARVDANARISDAVTTVNQQLTQIGALNTQIVAAKNVGQDPAALEDSRDQLVRDVSATVPVTVITDKSGAITLTLSGSRSLVSVDGGVHPLIAAPDPTTGDVRIERQTAGANEDITGLFTSGAIGGTISARDGALKDAQTAVDQLASDISTAYNTQHAAGVGLDGNTGRNLFTPTATVAGAASAFGVSSDVLGHPEFLAAAQDATGLPGDNRNALALTALHDQNVANGGTATVQQAFSALVAAAGGAASSASTQSDQATAALTQIDALRDSTSGVSTDDEMISLMKYQRAYQASLKVVQTADQMLSDLLAIPIGS
jgi:flagellar hook-associated protein 1 FlgK